MGTSQTVLPFKLAATDESLTAHGGLALFGEYLQAMGVCGLIDHELPHPGSAAGYSPSVHVLPLVLMLAVADGRWKICVFCVVMKGCVLFFGCMKCRAATPRAIGCGAWVRKKAVGWRVCNV